MSSAARVLHVEADDGAPVPRPAVLKERRKADERGLLSRDLHVVDSAILYRRAHDNACVPLSRTASIAGVSARISSYWSTDPLGHQPPLYSVLAHPAVSVAAAALLLERVALQLVAASAPLDIAEALIAVRAATAGLEALVARRQR